MRIATVDLTGLFKHEVEMSFFYDQRRQQNLHLLKFIIRLMDLFSNIPSLGVESNFALNNFKN